MSNLDLIIFLVITALAVLDGLITRRRIRKYGINVELNPLVRGAYSFFGANYGLFLAIVLPWIFAAVSGIFLGLPRFVGFLLGFRIAFGLNQLNSLIIERKYGDLIQKLTDDIAERIKKL